MHPHTTACPRPTRAWTTPLAHLLPAGIASLVGILLFAQMMASAPAKNPAVAAAGLAAVSWRVPAENETLATVKPEQRATAPKQAPQPQKAATEAPLPHVRTAAAKPAHLTPVQGGWHETPAGPPLELAAWQRPDPAPMRPRADLTGERPDRGGPTLVEPVQRAITSAQKLPEKVGVWIGDAAEWVGSGLSSVLPLATSRDGLRASL